MHHLSEKDAEHLEKSSRKYPSLFKTVVSYEALRTECDDNGILKKLFEDMIDFALRYTESVCAMERFIIEHGPSFDEQGVRQALEDCRRTIHNSFMDHVNILSRMMARTGKSMKWRNELGDNRSSLGRFGVVVSFEYIKATMKNEGGAA